MRAIFLVLMMITGAFNATCADAPEIVVQKERFDPGETVELGWRVPAGYGFMSGVGLVSGEGKTNIIPSGSIEVFLITQRDNAFSVTKHKIVVRGEKGESPFPDLDDFKTGISGVQAKMNYIDFLSAVQRKLQDDLKFRVRGNTPLPNANHFSFVTDRRPVAVDAKGSQSGMRKRRISYEVYVEAPMSSNQSVRFEVRALMDAQYLGEAQWRAESDAERVRERILELKNTLENLSEVRK